MPEPMQAELSIVGGVLIVSSGLGTLGIKDCKTVNMLPSLLVPVLAYLIKGVYGTGDGCSIIKKIAICYSSTEVPTTR